MNYFKLVFVSSIILFLALGACCGEDINGTDATSQSDAGTFNELQNLINEFSQGSAINLTKDYLSGEGDNFPEGIEINKSITINGNNHVIDANSKSRIFFVTSPSNVVINDIIFVNGKGDIYGGAYLSDFGGTINNCVFKDNSAISGGAVLAIGCKINNSTFINNSAVDGGAVYQNKGSIYDCTFIDNSAEFGGAVYQLNSSVHDSTFLNNHAGWGCDDICNASNHADKDDDSIGMIPSNSQNKGIDFDGNDAGNPIGLLILVLFVLAIRTKK